MDHAVSLAEDGFFEDALFAFACLEPTARCLEMQAQCLLELDRADEAVTAASAAVALQQDWPQAHLTAARAMRNAGDPERAVLAFAAAQAAAQACGDGEAAAAAASEGLEAASLAGQRPSLGLQLSIEEAFGSPPALCGCQHGAAAAAETADERTAGADPAAAAAGFGPGCRLWAAGIGLARWVSRGPHPVSLGRARQGRPLFAAGARWIELGAGTGVAGLALGSASGCEVTLTDMAAVLPLLGRNAAANARLVHAAGGSVAVRRLDWSDALSAPPPGDGAADLLTTDWDGVLAADCVYTTAAAAQFAALVAALLPPGSSGLLVMAHKRRSPAVDAALFDALRVRGFAHLRPVAWDEPDPGVAASCSGIGLFIVSRA